MKEMLAKEKKSLNKPTEKDFQDYTGYNYEELRDIAKSKQITIDELSKKDPERAKIERVNLFKIQTEMETAPFGYGKHSKRYDKENSTTKTVSDIKNTKSYKDYEEKYDPYKGTPYERKYNSVLEASQDPNSAINKYIQEKKEKKQKFGSEQIKEYFDNNKDEMKEVRAGYDYMVAQRIAEKYKIGRTKAKNEIYRYIEANKKK